jgi:hypothetical protein
MANVYTIYENVSYTFDEGKKRLYMSWDKSNLVLNELMFNELILSSDRKDIYTNLTFIDELKDSIKWKEGETIHFEIHFTRYCSSNGRVYIQILEDAYQDAHTFLELNGDGYVYIREFQGNCICYKDETEFASVKVNCYYNELTNERENLFILK